MESRQSAHVQFNGIKKSFSGTGLVINDVSFSVAPGEFLTILGPSGCGKSTFLRLAAELDRPEEGSIVVESFGQKYFRSFVFQDAHLLPWRTVVENIALPLELSGKKRKDALAQAEASLKRVRLHDA